ncbi:hypothetical protein FN846DRAFT_914757 [Sphaerosporella brunnea]|uniref:CFEM domain-containing protein n=1 Tax=Sphaerosporella brunnea TaxID=1250544 RepID=A0A5J5EBZ6_9PEZI|nr:hypothetical protein FN846DRAFT_914757 [Sphaerosporella brunnea]
MKASFIFLAISALTAVGLATLEAQQDAPVAAPQIVSGSPVTALDAPLASDTGCLCDDHDFMQNNRYCLQNRCDPGEYKIAVMSWNQECEGHHGYPMSL